MIITYEWNFPTITDYPTQSEQTNVAFTIHWKLKATSDDNRMAEIDGITKITYKENDTYIPFNQLTNEVLLQWMEREDAMGNLEIHKQYIANMIQMKITQ